MQGSPWVIDKGLFLQVKIMWPWSTGILPSLSYKQVPEHWQGILLSFCFLFIVENTAIFLSVWEKVNESRTSELGTKIPLYVN